MTIHKHDNQSIIDVINQNLATTSSPSLTGLTLSGLTNGIVKATSGILSGGNNVSLTSEINGILPVSNGGTNQTTYTNGQLLIGNTTGNTLTKATLTGTANQINVTNGTGSITLSLPQSIASTSSPAFVNLTLSGDLAVNGSDITSTSAINITPAFNYDFNVNLSGSSNILFRNSDNEFNFILESNAGSVGEVDFVFRKSRLGGVVQAGDRLARWLYAGHDGTQFYANNTKMDVVVEGTVSTNVVPAYFAWFTTPTGGTIAERMRLTSSGNFGIGITPVERFHTAKQVDGDAITGLFENSQSNTASSVNETNQLRFGFGGDNDTARIVIGKEGDYTSGANSKSFMSFYTDINGTVAEYMRITSSGKIGIGTTLPANIGYALLELKGTDSSSAGPHVQYLTSIDAYPLFQQLNFTHNNISLSFDAYFDGVFKSSDAGSNFSIYKLSDVLYFYYKSGVAKGSAITWNNDCKLTAAGEFYVHNRPVITTDIVNTRVLKGRIFLGSFAAGTYSTTFNTGYTMGSGDYLILANVTEQPSSLGSAVFTTFECVPINTTQAQVRWSHSYGTSLGAYVHFIIAGV